MKTENTSQRSPDPRTKATSSSTGLATPTVLLPKTTVCYAHVLNLEKFLFRSIQALFECRQEWSASYC
jgi:hypothetical protein